MESAGWWVRGIWTVTKPSRSGKSAEMTRLMKERGEIRKVGWNVWVIRFTV